MKITFCENNKGKKKLIEKLEEKYPEVEINIKGCIGKCKACSKSPIAKIKDEVIVGEDKEDLYEKIVKKLG
jgi:uncharacterized protein YuzB (UPF0349 family)